MFLCRRLARPFRLDPPMTHARFSAAQLAAMADPNYFTFFGADSRGTSTRGDVLVSHTSDGTDLNTVWDELAATLDLFNSQRSAIASLLSYPTTRQVDAVQQSVGGATLERASEFGVPTGVRGPEVATVAYGFADFDIASRFSWKFLRDADTRQVEAVHNQVLTGVNNHTTTAVLRRLFDPAPSVSPEGNAIYGLWNGDSTDFIPPYMGREFDPATETHYLATQSAVLDASDLEAVIEKVTSKGYTGDTGRQLLILAHPNEAKRIASFRAGKPGSDGVEAQHDFVPTAAAPARLTVESIVGGQAPSDYNGLPILGSYGPAYLVQSYFVPKGYIAVVATAGPNSEGNPIAFREHPRPEYRGLRIIPGSDQRYPIVSSYYVIGYGTGTRHRGAAACLQVTTNATYTAPTFAR